MKFTTNELKEFAGNLIDSNKKLQEKGRKPISLEIKGVAGLGKTSAILQLCQEKEMDLVKINLAQIEEIGDLVGFPIKEFEICHTKTGDCKWADEVAYTSFLTQGYSATGRHRMAYAPPEWIQGKTHSNGGVLLLDDWTRADMRFIQACMELIDRQQYISWSLPKGWSIMLTSNPSDSADYIVTDIDDAQKTRFMSVELKFDKDCWATWAESKIDGRCINFVLLNDDILKKSKTVNPRVLEMFFNSVSIIDNFKDNLPRIQMLGEASVGDEIATMFTMFINNKLDKLISPEKIFKLDKKELVSQITLNVGKGPDYRADIASVLAIRFSNYVSDYVKGNPITKDNVDSIEEIVKSNVLGEDNGYNLVRNIFNSDKKKFYAMLTRPTFMNKISQQ